MNIGMNFEQDNNVNGIFDDSHFGLRESINSTSTLGRQVAEEEDIMAEMMGSANAYAVEDEVFADRTNMVVNP